MAKYTFTIPQMACSLNINITTVHRRIRKLAIQGRKARTGRGLLFTEDHFKRIGKIESTITEENKITIIFENYNIFAIIESKINNRNYE